MLVTDNSQLKDGARVAVIGGGPAGSFFSFFLLELANRTGLDLSVDIYEPRDFNKPGPAGCNMCGGIVSESLVQTLATEGILLPPTVVQRGIEAYALHTDAGSVRISTPAAEKRIGAVHRGAGPLGSGGSAWQSFDGYLLSLAQRRGANLISEAITHIERQDHGPTITAKSGGSRTYDLLVIASGVNTSVLKLCQEALPGYRAPKITKTVIREYRSEQAAVADVLGDCMHLFLLNIPRLEFAAAIPKGNCITVCMLGEHIDPVLLDSFLQHHTVQQQLPETGKHACGCSPKMSISAARQPYSDRIVFIGDCSISRLYKDGIGAAYRTAKAAATTVVFHGVSAEAFRQHYYPACRAIDTDNRFGHFVFFVTRQIQRRPFAQRAVIRMVKQEQHRQNRQAMSSVLWDTFTGSAPYRAIFYRTFRPTFWLPLLWNIMVSLPSGLTNRAKNQSFEHQRNL